MLALAVPGVAGAVKADGGYPFSDIYKASLAIDAVRDMVLFGKDEAGLPPGTFFGEDAAAELRRRDARAPLWNADTLLNGNTAEYRLDRFRNVGDAKLNYLIFSDRDTVYLAFWGTNENLINQLVNAGPPAQNPLYLKAVVHTGWSLAAFTLFPTLRAQLEAHNWMLKRLIMTGHSQGAAIAGHTAFQMMMNLNRRLPVGPNMLVHFAGPRYGTPSFRSLFGEFNRAGLLDVYEIEIREDIIPTLYSDIVHALSGGLLFPPSDQWYIGKRINLPKSWAAKQFSNPHNHLYSVYQADRLAKARTSRPPTYLTRSGAFTHRAGDHTLAAPEDRIAVTVRKDQPADTVKITLRSSGDVYYWKGLKFFRGKTEIKEIVNNWNLKSQSFAFRPSPIEDYRLGVGKGSAVTNVPTWLKIHTADFWNMRGEHIILTWNKD
mmetsp:Transcript_23290/g.40270  ORF Transcript_23290/g.40270 Transcript_23290/m.40270 type:complete len:433 (+) Transcript_23290:777-2075(+)